MFSQNWHSHQSQTFETIIINISFFFCKFCEKKAHFKGRWFSSVDASGSADMSILWTYFSNLKLVSTVTCSCCKIISDNVKSLCCCCEASRTYCTDTQQHTFNMYITLFHNMYCTDISKRPWQAIFGNSGHLHVWKYFIHFPRLQNYS